MKCFFKTGFALGLLLVGNCSYAEFSANWNGFGTLGFSAISDRDVSDQGGVPFNDFKESVSEHIDTKLGFQGNFTFTDKLSATLQVSTRARHDYEVDAEWAYFTLQFAENFKLRAGRLRRSIFQYSDYLDVGYAYSWVRPPSINYFDIPPLYESIDAIDLYYEKAIGEWNFSTQTYIGGNGGKDLLLGQDLYYYESEPMGTTVEVGNEMFQFRFGYHRTLLTLLIDEIEAPQKFLSQLGFSNIANELNLKDTVTEFISISGAASHDTWKLGGEYSITDPNRSIQPKVFSWYLGLEKNFGLYTVYYSYGRQNVEHKSDVVPKIDAANEVVSQNNDAGSQLVSSTLTSLSTLLNTYFNDDQSKRSTNILGLRYDVKSSVALKFEFERLNDLRFNKSANIFSVSLDFLY